MTIAKKYEDVVAERDAALAREAALREELDSLKRDSEQDTTIDERDRCHEIADSLALAISQHFRVEIGEHSSMNCPWRVALDVMNGAYITDTDEGRERDALQQRLTVAEQLLRRVIACGELTRINHAELEVDVCKWLKPVTPAEPVTFGHEYNNLSVAERSAMQVTARIQEVAALKPAEENTVSCKFDWVKR